jgi:hypothetical protein
MGVPRPFHDLGGAGWLGPGTCEEEELNDIR